MVPRLASVLSVVHQIHNQREDEVSATFRRVLTLRARGLTAMLMTIRFQNGRRDEAVLLAANRDRIRIVTRSRRDAIELRNVNAYWFMEDWTAIEIETFIPLEGTDVSAFCAEVYPRTFAAGTGFTPA
jgi:hypothetical protein